MSNSIYHINRGINKSIEFKGLKAQYIWYFGGGVVALLIVFAILYTIGVNSFVCIGIIGTAGAILVIRLYALSNTYGEHGMMKMLARRSVPEVIQSKSRDVFLSKRHRNS